MGSYEAPGAWGLHEIPGLGLCTRCGWNFDLGAGRWGWELRRQSYVREGTNLNPSLFCDPESLDSLSSVPQSLDSNLRQRSRDLQRAPFLGTLHPNKKSNLYKPRFWRFENSKAPNRTLQTFFPLSTKNTISAYGTELREKNNPGAGHIIPRRKTPQREVGGGVLLRCHRRGAWAWAWGRGGKAFALFSRIKFEKITMCGSYFFQGWRVEGGGLGDRTGGWV